MRLFTYSLINILLISIFFYVKPLEAKQDVQYKIFAVMSYHAEYQWQQQLKEGIEAVLGNIC
ncbi:MAG: hypothetical protein GY857_06675, partial [Desulfobacula sp.]|nr:hypothetical protein [Desulfobacula sp.]